MFRTGYGIRLYWWILIIVVLLLGAETSGFLGRNDSESTAWGIPFRFLSYFKKRDLMRMRNTNVAFPASFDILLDTSHLLTNLCIFRGIQKLNHGTDIPTRIYADASNDKDIYNCMCIDNISCGKIFYKATKDIFGHDINSESLFCVKVFMSSLVNSRVSRTH